MLGIDTSHLALGLVLAGPMVVFINLGKALANKNDKQRRQVFFRRASWVAGIWILFTLFFLWSLMSHKPWTEP